MNSHTDKNFSCWAHFKEEVHKLTLKSSSYLTELLDDEVEAIALTICVTYRAFLI